jgi:hypothetical protein
MKRITKMLSLTRAHGGDGERVFVKKFIMPYEPTIYTSPTGEVLAYVIEVVGKATSSVLFSGHVDTVHSMKDPVYQEVTYDPECYFFYKGDAEDKMPLGADNAAGCWLMLEMIDNLVPGTYIFHRGEERGGTGSRGMADHHAEWLSQFEYAIAFDRRGEGDIITEMFCGRTCSDAFAEALAGKINQGSNEQFTYKPNDTGSFTDTANYIRLIPECTNVSVGYDHEHSNMEVLDFAHLEKLRDALVQAFSEGTGDLPVVRKVDDVDEGRRYAWDFSTDFFLEPHDKEDVLNMSLKELEKYVTEAHPEDVAELLLVLAEDAHYAETVAVHEKYAVN